MQFYLFTLFINGREAPVTVGRLASDFFQTSHCFSTNALDVSRGWIDQKNSQVLYLPRSLTSICGYFELLGE